MARNFFLEVRAKDLLRRHKATMNIFCAYGSPRTVNDESKKWGRVGSPSGPKVHARMRHPPQPKILPQGRQGAERTKSCRRTTLLGRRVRPMPAPYLPVNKWPCRPLLATFPSLSKNLIQNLSAKVRLQFCEIKRRIDWKLWFACASMAVPAC